MKNIALSISVILLVITSYNLYRSRDIIVQDSNNYIKLKDSIAYIETQNTYLQNNLYSNFLNRNHDIPDTVNMFEISLDSLYAPQNLLKWLNSGKSDKMIIRYTELGCSACADSVFKILSKNEKILKSYETIVLVDFVNYQDYLTWRKISNVDLPVYWVKNGHIPTSFEKEKKSYIFTWDLRKKCIKTILSPNSRQPDILRFYFKSIL